MGSEMDGFWGILMGGVLCLHMEEFLDTLGVTMLLSLFWKVFMHVAIPQYHYYKQKKKR